MQGVLKSQHPYKLERGSKMRNSRNKKRLTSLVTAFMLTFVVGTAFAFAPGMLDIGTIINLSAQEDLYVVWSDVTGGPDFQLLSSVTPAGWEIGARHTARIVNERGRTNQRIEWTINFSEEGFAAITATATNNSLQPVIITGGNATWSNIAIPGLTAVDFGLMEDVSISGFVGETLSPGDSTSMTVYVFWDGTVPAGFTASDDYAFAANLTVTFDYAPAA